MNKPPTSLAAGLTMLAPIPAAIAAAVSGGTPGIVAAVVSLGLAGLAAARLRRPATPPVPVSEETLRRVRHDLRGALAPALLTTDRLLASADPATQRSGAIIQQSVEKAIGLISELGLAK
jgi:hypothetical protein